MADPVLLRDTRDGVRVLTLNRPEKRNALNHELVAELKAGLREAGVDPSVNVVLLEGAGQDFCSGADLAELQRIADMGPEESFSDAMSLGALFLQMRDLPKPVIGAVQGRALAGGCGLATACDLVVASDGAQFGYPEVHLGFVPAMVMTVLRRKVGEGIAFELVTRGDRISAPRAAEIGLVNQVFPAPSFRDEALRYAAELATRPPSAVALTKGLLYELDSLGFEEGITRGAEVNVEARMSEACRKGVRAFLDRSRS